MGARSYAAVGPMGSRRLQCRQQTMASNAKRMCFAAVGVVARGDARPRVWSMILFYVAVLPSGNYKHQLG